MKHLHFDVETASFYGAYWACAGGSSCAVIAMIGDDPEDRLARSAAKWLGARGVNILTMSPAKKDYGHHNYPLERVETAISWLKANGNKKIGIAGASTTGTLALTAAAMFPDITLTIAMTPSDFVWQGFMQGKRDGCKEWPVEGESLFSYRKVDLDKAARNVLTQEQFALDGGEGEVASWRNTVTVENVHPNTTVAFRMNNLSGSAAELKLYAYGADGKLAEVSKELWTITDEAGTGVDTLADGTLYELRVSVADGGAFDLSEAEKEIKISVVLAK